jgi:solute carrier family 24 (sodium/potassium/calcium exchanger), member 6
VPSISIQDEEGEVWSPDAEMSLLESPTEDTPPNPLTSKRKQFWLALTKTMRMLFPTLVYFTEKSIVGMVAALFAAPAMLALTLTLPVVVTPREDENTREKALDVNGRSLDGGAVEEQLIDYEDESAERTLMAEKIVEEEMHELRFNKWLMAAQCVLGPLFCAAVLLGEMKQFPLYAAVIGVVGTVAALLVLIFADNGRDPTACIVRCSMGFFVAIVWIMAIADEVVQVLQVRDSLKLFRNTRY